MQGQGSGARQLPYDPLGGDMPRIDDIPEEEIVKVRWMKRAAKAYRVIEQGEGDERKDRVVRDF